MSKFQPPCTSTPSIEDVANLRSLSGMANNLNQLAHEAHVHHFSFVEKRVLELAGRIDEVIVRLGNFSRLDDRTSQRADYIEWLYSDEDEHCQEIDELWQKRMERLSNKKIKVIMSEQQNNSPIQAAVNALNGLCAFSRSE